MSDTKASLFDWAGNPRAVYLHNSTGGSLTLTATATTTAGTPSEMLIVADEYTPSVSGTLDKSGALYTAGGPAVPCAASSFTTSAADFLWGVILQPQNVTVTVGSGFTLHGNNVDTWYTESMKQGSPGSANPGWTVGSGANDNYAACEAVEP